MNSGVVLKTKNISGNNLQYRITFCFLVLFAGFIKTKKLYAISNLSAGPYEPDLTGQRSVLEVKLLINVHR